MRTNYKRLTAFLMMAAVLFGLATCQKEKIDPPTVKVFEGAISLTYTSASVSAEVTDQGGAEVKSKGFVYGISGGSLDTVFCGGGTGVYSAELTNLQPNTTYVYEAFARNAGGTGTSGKVTFTTRDHELPIVKTAEVENVGTTTASCGGNVTTDGGASITERGVCWGTNHNPSVNENHVSSGSGLGEFACNMSNLSANTTYYVRAYAKNSKGTAYGEEKHFTTQDFDLPEVITAPVTDITQTSAKGGGEVTSDGGTTVTERGICWSLGHNPTINNHKILAGEGMGSFTCDITGLDAHTTYYVRAYAINSKGTVYGDEVAFNTSANLPTVSTGSVSNIATSSATGSGNVTNDGGSDITERGLCWSTNHEPTINGTHIAAGDGTGEFTASMTGLTTNTVYYVRAYATNGVGTSYGDEIEFHTLTISAPSVTTASVTRISQTTATGGGNVISDGGTTVTERGICWSTSHNPTISGSHQSNGTGLGSYTINMTGLTPNTTYYVKAYAANSIGITYGEEVSFTTLPINKPTVTTNNITNVTQTTATCGGNVTSDGGATVTVRGVCWSLSQNPTVSGNHTTDGSGTGTFTSQITGLTLGKTYYVRAYATNSEGTSYGEQKTFTTSSVSLPTVTTNNVTNITQTTATCGGNVTADGGSTVTARGVCWSTSQNPTVSGNHTTNGTGTGSFTSSITGLTSGTTYYVRAYATNSVGTIYGEQKTFTATSVNLPTVTTNTVTSVQQTTATCGGNVTNAGGGTVTARGVCWSTSSNPTIYNSHTSNGTGTGSFTSSITGLSPNTTYYVRAYATNGAGTAYGSQRSFTTLPQATLPTVTTNSVTDITQNTATCGGNVTNAGNAAVSARGVCWSTSPNPTIYNSHTTNGTGTGSFTSALTGLTVGTTYYVRAYATNSVGTAYGETRSFTTVSKYAYASKYAPATGYIKYPINNPNSETTINSSLYLLGGDYYNGYLYAYGYTDPDDKYYFYKINATTGSIVSSHYVGADVFCSDCAYDHTTNRLYGCNGGDLYTINLNTGAQTYVGSLGINNYMVALFCNASGQLYGVETGVSEYGKFYSINKSTGSATLIATLNYYVNYAQSGGFDQNTGTLYWAGYVSDSRSSGVELSSGLADGKSRAEWYGIIATINPNTGSVTILHTGTGEQCAWSLR